MSHTRTHQSWNLISHPFLAALVGLVAAGGPAQAQTFKVLHTFTGGADGGTPASGLVMDRSGNLYGDTAYGGNTHCHNASGDGCGVVFKLNRQGSGWLLAPLYTFAGGTDGSNPFGSPTIAGDGTIYGTTNAGGGGNCGDELGSGCGTVFRLRPPASRCRTVLCPWNETVAYRFSGGADGNDPWAGVVVDGANNVFGTTYHGGSAGLGEVFELTPAGSGWTKSTIHPFAGGTDGAYPATALTLNGGNLYGTTMDGGGIGQCLGGGCGTVFQLTPTGSGWNQNILYSFGCGNDGCLPRGTPIFDPAGNLYGTSSDGINTVFELTPSGGSWNFTGLYGYDFGGLSSFTAGVVRDAAGNLYGTSEFGGNYTNCVYGCGLVYKLTPSSGGWIYSTLYEFTGRSDGANPLGGVIVDDAGNLYGTTLQGGSGCLYGCGAVWEITP